MAEKEKEKRSGFVGNAPPPLDPTEIRKAKKFSFLDRARIALTGKAPDNYFTASWRNVPAETALTQQKEQIFDLWRSEEYWRMVAKRYLPDLGLGFTTSPYVGPWEYVWGVTPVEDYAKYKEIFIRDPYVHAAITLMVQLTVSKGFQLFSNRPEGKEIVAYLENWCNQHDILEILRIVVTDMLVFGNAYLEVIRLFSCVEKDFQDDRLEEAQKHQEATGHKINSQITWLKPLPAETMRVNRDPWGSVLGYVQMLTFPPVHFLPSEIIFFKYEAKSWNYECFTPDTLVRTSNGFKKISDVKIGDKVIMHTGKWGKVLQVKSFPVDEELIEVRTSHSNIPILSTPTHPYYARPLYITSGGFKKLQSEQFVLAQNLKPRDYLLVPIDREEKDVPYILLGDYLDITTLNRVAPTKSKIHTKIQVNADFMYLVGLFLGDGCVIRDRITFAFNGLKEEQLAQETKELINNVFGLHAWITRPKNTNSLEVSVKSRFLSRLFKMLFNEGAHNKSIPEWIMKLPPYKQLHLLRGLFDSDGYTKKDGKSITISTVSENMAHQIYTLFLRQNQIPSIHKRTPKINTPFKDGHVAHSGTIYNITVYVRKTTKRGNGWAKGRIENDYLWLPIKSVKRVPYKGSVWNLEVDKEHTFTVGLGYAVHNSAYGISILRSLLRIEALIKEFEDVIGQAMWSYNFPKFIVEVGVEGKPPPTDSQMQEVMDSFAARGPGTDIFVRHGDVLKDVKVLEPPTAPLAASEWWLTYLTKNRAAALGVPEFFLGTVTGNRAAVDVISQEFVSRLTVIQNVLSKKLMRELFPSLIEEKFGKVEIIPEIVWNPIFDEPSDLKIAKAVQLFESGLVPLDEARLIVGKPALDKEIYGDFGLTFSPKAYGVTTQNPSSQPLVGLESSQSTTSAQPNAQSQSTQNNPRTALNDVSMWRKKYESDDDEPPEFLTREEFKEYLNNLKKRTMFPKVKGEE